MILWSEILTIICSLTAIVSLLFYAGNKYIHLRIFLSLSLINIILNFSTSFGLDLYETEILEWTKIISVSFALVVTAILIREMKPTYARYPVLFSYVPLLIIAVYPFISDAAILKNVLNQMLQGGAIIVAVLLYFSMYKILSRHYLYILGILLFACSFGFYWYSGDYSSMYTWAWQLPLSIGIIVLSFKISELFMKLEPA